MAASVVFYCVIVLQDYNEIYGSFRDWDPWTDHRGFYLNTNQKYGIQIDDDIINACWDHYNCAWYYFPQLDERDWSIFQPDASPSEINHAKELLVNQSAEWLIQQVDIEQCFSPLVLSMHRKIMQCNSIYVKYIGNFFGNDECEQKTILDTFCKEQGPDCLDCISYKKNQTDLTCYKEFWPYYDVTLYPELAKGFLTNDFQERQKATIALIKQIVVSSNGGLTTHQVEKCLNEINVIYQYQRSWLLKHEDLSENVKSVFNYITYILACCGLPSNLALFYTYWKKDLAFRFNILMLLIASFDFAYLITEIVSTSLEDQFNIEFNKYHGTLGFFYFFTFGGSVYTTTLMAIERFMIMCFGKDTDKIPIGWTILFIIGLVSMINIHNFVPFEHKSMQMAISVNNLVSILPTLPMIVFNVILYKKLKALLASDESFQSDVDLQNCVFRAKITVLIGWIYVCSQVLTWIFSIIHMILPHTLEYKTVENPLDLVGVMTVYAYLKPIVKILKVINCSVNYFSYRFLLAKEKIELRRGTSTKIEMSTNF